MGRNALYISILCLALALSACAAQQVRDVQPTGFLGDYSQLKPGDEGYAAMTWFKKGTDMKPYDKILLDPVLIYFKNANATGINPQDMLELTKFYQDAIVTALTRDNGYTIVDKPGPGVLRMRVAITDVVAGNPVLATLGTVTPVGLAISGGMYAATGSNNFVGEAATEIEVLDAASNERLAAVIDRRAGGKVPFRAPLSDAKDAFKYWADRLRLRLDAVRGLGPKPQ